jgi:hypothetical protein
VGNRYCTDLADVVRHAGLECIEMDGWQTRARSSGGFNSPQPTYIMCHHTASNPGSDGWSDANYIATGSDIAPISQLYVNRAGTVWVCAAGACNNAGSGGPLGSVPVDAMNTYSIALEVANNGVGEPWPQVQQEAYQRLVQALCDHYGIPAGNVVAHWEWTPRKIDPAGQSRWAQGAASWNMDAFRADVAAGWPGGTPIPPQPQPEPPPAGWVCPPFPGVGDYGCTYETCRAWQDAMILNRYISDNPANHDGAWGDGMHNATYDMQLTWGWSDADGIGGEHTWPHLRSRNVALCPVCGK